MRVLLVQPPRPLWPFINEQDNYILPQWVVCLAAALRRAGVEVHALDCMPVRMGWRSLGDHIRKLRPDVVCTGENHALFASTVVRLVKLVKAINPDIVTVAGGGHFTNTVDYYLPETPVDFIIRGEGEDTLVELIAALERGGIEAGRQVAGLAYHDGQQVCHSAPRALIADLDSLPMPAYDMLPLRRYGTAKYLFSPGGATIHHSRGCTGSCRFCAWWRQMAKRKVSEDEHGCRAERLVPQWRTKSVERTLEEVELLYRAYDKRCLVFVDPTFNIDPRWNDAFAEALIAKNWDLNWFAFMRADMILRDEKLGVFEKLVRSGLCHLCIGVERMDDEQLATWNKPGARANDYIRCFDLLRNKYPQVFRQATFIVGTQGESRESAMAQLDYARRIRADYPAFHPVTPFPGTDLYKEALSAGKIELHDFDYFDMMTAIMPTDHMSCEEVEEVLVELNKRYVTVPFLLRGLTSKVAYRRNMYIWFLQVAARVFVDAVKQRANPFSPEPYTSAFTPDWYES